MLLLGNCSADRSPKSLPTLYNVDYQFVLPNMTSKLQLLDASIIAAVKFLYREKQYDYSHDCIDAGAAGGYKIDQSTSMRWIRDYSPVSTA